MSARLRGGARLDRRRLSQLTAFSDVTAAGYEAVETLVRESESIQRHAPRQTGNADAHEEVSVLYSEARLHRPHDTGTQTSDCPICLGSLPGVVDCAPLGRGRGVTFTSPNLYPIAVPAAGPAPELTADVPEREVPVHGLHFVQWCSTRHDLDLHNMAIADIVVILERLAAFEEVLLYDPGAARAMPVTGRRRRRRRLRGHLGVIKNFGAPVGGSLAHGHQQLAHLSVLPRSTRRDIAFATEQRVPYEEWLRRETPRHLRVASYPGGVRLLVPPAARRPLQACIVTGASKRSFLHELTPRALEGLATALRESTAALHQLLPRLGRVVSYNLIFHLHPATGAYVEILPFTQEVGGYERLGVYLSHATPETSAQMYREAL
jgi:galactose-1-phosphate uridylyltransferase